MAGYVWWVGTLADGRLTSSVPVVSSSWADVMDDAGPLQMVLALADPDVRVLNPYLIAEPARCFMAIAYVDEQGTETWLQGGPVWTHSYDAEDGQLTIGGSGIWSYYDHRKVLPVLASGVSAASVTTTINGVSLGTVAKRLVQLAHTHTHGSVPVVLPADLAGTSAQVYPGSDLSWVGDMLRNLTGVENGPEIRFTPRRRADDGRFIEWVMEVGTTAQPLLVQAGDDWRWDASAEQSSVVSLSVQRDGTGVAETTWAKGSGSDVGTLISHADDPTLLAAGFPLTELDLSGHESVTDLATLAGWARSGLAAAGRPVETWSVKVRRDEDPPLGSYRPGHRVQFIVGDDDPYLPSGTYATRVTGVTGDDSADVTLQLAPTVGGIS